MKNGFIYIGNNVFSTLLALSDEEQKKGLMHIKPPTPIMTFVYKYARVNKFWMANTPSKLDILFCINGKISQIHTGEPYDFSSIGNDEKSDLVIELPYGTVKAKGIKIGQNVGFLNDTKADLKKLNF